MSQKGIKYDEGKLRYDLVPPESLEETVRVITFGAKKYEPNNWKLLADPHDRYMAAVMRHIEKYRSGVIFDEETGIHHLAHAACGLLFLLYFDKGVIYEKRAGDDCPF